MAVWLNRRKKQNMHTHSACIPVLNTYEHTKAKKCMGCGLCAEVCPVNALQVKACMDDKKRVIVEEFFFDSSVCVQCGLCVDACPTNAIDFQMRDAGDSLKTHLTDVLLEREGHE